MRKTIVFCILLISFSVLYAEKEYMDFNSFEEKKENILDKSQTSEEKSSNPNEFILGKKFIIGFDHKLISYNYLNYRKEDEENYDDKGERHSFGFSLFDTELGVILGCNIFEGLSVGARFGFSYGKGYYDGERYDYEISTIGFTLAPFVEYAFSDRRINPFLRFSFVINLEKEKYHNDDEDEDDDEDKVWFIGPSLSVGTYIFLIKSVSINPFFNFSYKGGKMYEVYKCHSLDISLNLEIRGWI